MADKTLRVTAAQIEESVERLHNHSNFSVLDSITSSRINEWDNKSNGEHTHTADEIEGLDNLNVDLSNYYTKAEVNEQIANVASKEEVANLAKQISSLNASISSLTNANTTLTNKITALETKVAELDLQLNPPIVEEMYYGRLSFQDVGGKVIQYNQITEAMIKKGVTDGKLTKTTPKTMGKTSMGLASETTEFDYIVIAVPSSKNYRVTKDNGIGGKVIFDESTAGANGIDITINNVPCKLYGEMLLSQVEYFIYVD